MNLAEFLGYLSTFLFTIMLIPQYIKTIKSRNVEGVSGGLFWLCLMANVIALWYALLIKQNPLILKYSLAIFTTGVYIFIYINLRRKQ